MPHYELSYSKTRPGLLYAWKARAKEYYNDPWNTYGTPDKNKFSWTWDTLKYDPLGLLIGRVVPDEADIERMMRQYEKDTVSGLITANSDYNKVGGITGRDWDHRFNEQMRGKGQNNYSHYPVGDEFQKALARKKIEHSDNYTWVEIQGEGEKKVERRDPQGGQYWIHLISGGWYKWNPEKGMTGTTTSSKNWWPALFTAGDGACGGEPVAVAPIRGPNLRGEYARGLRHANTPVYTYTNEGETLDVGCGH